MSFRGQTIKIVYTTRHEFLHSVLHHMQSTRTYLLVLVVVDMGIIACTQAIKMPIKYQRAAAALVLRE
jgi:hypothetical protein